MGNRNSKLGLRLVFVGTLVCACGVWACGGPAAGTATPAPADDPLAEDSEAGAVSDGEKAIQAGDFAKAKEILSGVVSRQPNHAKACYLLGVALENLGDPTGAEQQYRKAISLSPDLTEAVLNLTAFLVDAQRFEEAEKILVEATRRHPRDPDLHINLGYARLDQNNLSGARQAFDAALAISDTPSVRLGLAELQLRAKQPDVAIPHIRSAKDRSSADVDILVQCADKFRRAGAPELCVDALDGAIKLRPIAELYVSRGTCKVMNKDTAGARADYEKAISIEPGNAPAHFQYGRFLLQVEQNKAGAIKEFETCARLAPQSDCQQWVERARK
ncbi:MAG: tetratricopeptide repeat protein [Polyangiaceae bacterium]|nr:tetratricopeptide repeat protein [Polyangiaceae bacterium]